MGGLTLLAELLRLQDSSSAKGAGLGMRVWRPKKTLRGAHTLINIPAIRTSRGAEQEIEMGKMPKSYFQTLGRLHTNDYLVSDNGLFYAIMQSDGNFCVYRGSGPTNSAGTLWCTNRLAGGNEFHAILFREVFGVYRPSGKNIVPIWRLQPWPPIEKTFAIMQDDGNFCIYKGTGPSDQGDYLWGTQVTDALSDFEISSIDYDISKSTIKETTPADIYRQSVVNDTDTQQTSTIQGSESVSEMSGWSSKFGVRVGMKTNFKSGIPLLAEGKVEVSVDVSYEYTWNGSTTHTKSWSFSTPVTVKPKSKVVVVVTVSVSTISVPYTLTGSFVLKSGARISGKVTGTYTGKNSHNLEVHFFQPAENGGYVPIPVGEVQGQLAFTTT